jgi:hypothetical protein
MKPKSAVFPFVPLPDAAPGVLWRGAGYPEKRLILVLAFALSATFAMTVPPARETA